MTGESNLSGAEIYARVGVVTLTVDVVFAGWVVECVVESFAAECRVDNNSHFNAGVFVACSDEAARIPVGNSGCNIEFATIVES